MMRVLTALVCAALLAAGAVGTAAAQVPAIRAPEPNPPAIGLDIPESPIGETLEFMAPSPAPSVEWTFHKTMPDGTHPDGNEQQLVWMANRARSNPIEEGLWLSGLCSGGDALITAACDYFVVDTGFLRSAFAAIPVRPPAAFDSRLYSAAKSHSDYLITTDTQTHDWQLQRVTDSGFDWKYWSGIVFSYSKNALYGHAAFNIDWGEGPNGMQDPPGHRKAIMSIIDNIPSSIYYSNVGYAVVSESSSNTEVGPQVITGNFVYSNNSSLNRFIVGTVWEDTNGNQQYDPGEGLNGVMVMPDSGTYYAITGAAGGYAVPILTAGTYILTFSGGELIGTYTRTVPVGSVSVLQDLEYFTAGDSSFNPGAWNGVPGGSSSSSDDGGGGGGGGGGGCFLEAAGTGAPAPAWAAAVLATAYAVLRKRG